MEPLLIVPIFMVVMALAIYWTFRRSCTILDRWAERSGYEILGRRWLMFGGKAFWWRKSKHHMVYYVTLRDAEGRIRNAYVRCGSWFLGLFSDHTTVEWDD